MLQVYLRSHIQLVFCCYLLEAAFTSLRVCVYLQLVLLIRSCQSPVSF